MYTRKIHTKLHPGPEWRIFHIPTSEDIDDVISRFCTSVCVWLVVYIITRTLHVTSKKCFALVARTDLTRSLRSHVRFYACHSKFIQ